MPFFQQDKKTERAITSIHREFASAKDQQAKVNAIKEACLWMDWSKAKYPEAFHPMLGHAVQWRGRLQSLQRARARAKWRR